MPITAYSMYYKGEVDAEQLVGLILGTGPSDAELGQSHREWIRSDIQCSSCGNTGAQIVRSARKGDGVPSTRQAHFRFLGADGKDAHHPLCEFYGSGDSNVKRPVELIDFGSTKSEETRLVRELVCKGIESNIFGQPEIRRMRQWFFDLKVANRFKVDISAEAIDWASKLMRHHPSDEWPFHPAHAQMPDFDWRRAACQQFAVDNRHLLKAVRTVYWIEFYRTPEKLKKLAAANMGHSMFDVRILKPYYDKAVEMARFVAASQQKRWRLKAPEYYRHQGAPIHLSAFCALLLSISNWDLNLGIYKFAEVIAAPAPKDVLRGNVIGLNPFHEYAAWSAILIASEIASQSKNGFDYESQLASTETRLRERHRLWQEGGAQF